MGYAVQATSFSFSLRYVGRLAVVCVAYLAAAAIALTGYTTGTFPSAIWPATALIWPPTAVALVALFFWGYDMWPAVAFAVFIANVWIGVPFGVVCFFVAGNTLEALVGVYALRNIVQLNPLFERIGDSLGLIVTGAAVSVISASFGVIGLVFGKTIALSAAPETWLAWWFGDTLAAIVLAPFFFRWLAKPFFTRTRRKILEETAAFVLLGIAESLAFFDPIPQLQQIPLTYLFIPLLWISLRTGMRGITLANVATALFVLSGILSGHSAFASGISTNILFVGQIFVATISIVFFVFTATVEERRAAERLLQAHVGTLENVVEKISSEDQAKSDFLAILAHELRNPLAPIVSALELIKINGIRPENVKLFEIIDSQVHTIERLLDDLLDTTRILHKKFKLQKEPMELQSVLHHSFETVRPFIKARKHTLSFSMPEEAVWLFADPIRISQIFVNVLYNAAKYTPAKGKIAVMCRQQGSSKIQVEIADSGVGIEPELFKKIFEPFVQASESPSEIGTGLGLGLALTKQLVELHNGSISVASEGKDKGSAFTITLPILETAPLPLPVETPRAAEAHGEAAHIAHTIYDILVVDDNEVAAHVLQKLLEHDGHTVKVVHTGKAAIEYVEENHPEALVLDIGLPDVNGYEVAKRLREKFGPTLLLIALSGYGQKEDIDKAMKAGFDYHLTKPIGVNDIENLLQRAKAS